MNTATNRSEKLDRQPLDEYLGVLLTRRDREALELAAAASDLPISTWARTVLRGELRASGLLRARS